MADYDKQVNDLWDEWMSETEQSSGDPDEFIDWAVSAGRLALRPQEIKKIYRRQVTTALRKAKRYDEEGGFEYRAKQSAMLTENGKSRAHYFDTDTGGSPALRQKSVKQRREAIAGHVYRAACDVDRMNKVFTEDPQLNFFADFSEDIIERRIDDEAAKNKKAKKG